MTQTTHTPGPWEIYQSTICTGDGKANEIAKITTYGVWMGDGSPYGPRNPIGDANAHLIKAAPEMLEALEALAPILADEAENRGLAGSDMSDYQDEILGALGRVNAAIAKAKGQ